MKPERRIVITGMSVVAGNGKNKEEFYANSLAGKSGIKECTVFPTKGLRTPYFGQIEQEVVYEGGTWEEQDRMEALMEIALDQMYQDASCTREEIAKTGRKTAICLGSLLAETGKVMAFARHESQGEVQPSWLSHTVSYGTYLKEKSGAGGGLYIDSAACASGTTAAGMAFDLIRNHHADRVIVGGADPLTEVAAYGFHALAALSLGVCNPFDENRDGINIGEGAAFFLFETLEEAQKRNAHIYGEVLGYGLNNDAYHITSPDPDGVGAVASMKQAISQGKLSPKSVDYINTHGTGTHVNDPMECKALEVVFQEHTSQLKVNSTKALVGHCMGASGAVELAAVLLGMERGKLFPMPRLEKAMEEAGPVKVSPVAEECEITYALSNSFAFAGNTASLLVGAYREDV